MDKFIIMKLERLTFILSKYTVRAILLPLFNCTSTAFLLCLVRIVARSHKLFRMHEHDNQLVKWLDNQLVKWLSFLLIFFRFTTKNLAEKIKGLQGGQTVDISDLMNLDERKSRYV